MPARILVVDDDPLSAELICEILCSASMDASFLTSSTEAVARLKREKYHAVFLDMRMPAPDGAEITRQIRASRVNSSAVIVMITGEEDRSVMRRAFAAGVEFFLFKPVERNKLLKLIRVTEGPIERERRRFTRVRLRCRVSMEAGNDRLEGTTLDLSLGGALVQSPRAFPSDTLVTISLELEAGTSLMSSGAASDSNHRDGLHGHSVQKPRAQGKRSAARVPPAADSCSSLIQGADSSIRALQCGPENNFLNRFMSVGFEAGVSKVVSTVTS